MKSSSKRRWIVAALIVLLLFLFRPGASRLKSRIIASISSGVGRSVDIGSVRFRLLPRPGFDLENLVVYDDPAFGAEPMLRAGEVIASLRLTSLARGRLEIARLDLTEPSLNLVRAENGRWNVQALLERSAHTPLAPTAKANSEPRPGFPYIEASSARINFMGGREKKPFALTNADFSLWQDSENAWGVRLQAQPMRTDLNLNDTGILRVSGNWQRAPALRDTPLQFTLEWSRAQLGQLTKLLTGMDRGWRGGVQLDAILSGTPAKLGVASDASIDDFRRYDITSGRPLRLAAHCDAQFSSPDQTFHALACTAPVGDGTITLKGDTGLPRSSSHHLELIAENVPAGSLVAFAERTKRNLPDDLAADGIVNGNFSYEQTPGSTLRFEGKGEIAQFRLASAAIRAEIGPETVPFVFTSGDDSESRVLEPALRKNATGLRMPEGPQFEFGPLSFSVRHPAGATARGWISRDGYGVLVKGETEIASILRLARMFGIPAPQAAAEGVAQVDLAIGGPGAEWSKGETSDFPGPRVTGTAKLHNVRIGIRGTAGPIEILSADLQLTSEQARITKLNAKAAGTSWTGSLELPRGCGVPVTCQLRFDLGADRIALGGISEWISPRPKSRPWYRILSSPAKQASAFDSLRASGRITIERLEVQKVAVTHVSAKVSVEDKKLEITDLSADFLGGKHHGEWQADFASQPAVCGGSGRFTGVPLARVAETMQDAWITGLAGGSYQVKGLCSAEFWRLAEGTLKFDVRDGTLAHISLTEDEERLNMTRLSGEARLRGGQFQIQEAVLDSPSGRFQLSGTATLERELNLKLARTTSGATAGFSITGRLAAPHVAALPGTEQARLKP